VLQTIPNFYCGRHEEVYEARQDHHNHLRGITASFFSQKDRSHLRVNRCLIQHIDNLTEIWCEHSQLH
jgi:hypothetical protein